MTEAEWLACEDPDPMLKFLGKKYSPRKLRLFAVACCRTVWHILGEAGHRAVEVAESFAEGQVSREDLDRAGDAAFADPRAGGILGGQDGIHPDQRRHGGAGGERERQAVSAARAFGIPGDAGGSRGPARRLSSGIRARCDRRALA